MLRFDLLAAFSLLASSQVSASAPIEARLGHFLLPPASTLSEHPVSLNGDWEFRWNELQGESTPDSGRVPSFQRVPGPWTGGSALRPAFGVATYRLVIDSESRLHGMALALPEVA